MKKEFKYSTEIVNGKELTICELIKGNGAITININQILEEESISEASWLTDKEEYFSILYIGHDDFEYYAIIDTDGNVIKKGIREIVDTIEDYNYFIVSFMGTESFPDASYYGLHSSDDWAQGVINSYGEYIIEPTIDNDIDFDPDEKLFNVFVNGKEYIYNQNGRRIE